MRLIKMFIFAKNRLFSKDFSENVDENFANMFVSKYFAKMFVKFILTSIRFLIQLTCTNLGLSCPGHPVSAVLPRLSGPCCLVLAIRFSLACQAVLSSLRCPDWPFYTDLSGWPIPADLRRHNVPAVLFWLSSPGSCPDYRAMVACPACLLPVVWS